MRPLRVALIWAPYRLEYNADDRQNFVGWWSYPTPEFEVYPYWLGKDFTLDVQQIARRGLDLIIAEDGALAGHLAKRGDIPVVYHVVDSRLDDLHYQKRRRQAQEADGLLLDLDDRERWEDLGKPIGRLAYCVNDRLFQGAKDRPIDVNFNCRLQGQDERLELDGKLRELCEARGWVYTGGWKRGDDYPARLNAAKVAVNLMRPSLGGRNHRCFDAMASGAALLTSPLRDVEGEVRTAGYHYVEWRDWDELVSKLEGMLDHDRWQKYGPRGAALMREYHTWAIRSQELAATLREMFPRLETGE